MEFQVPDYLFAFDHIARFILLAATLSMIWFAVMRVRQDRAQLVKIAAVVGVGLLVWLAIAYVLGQRNTYWVVNNPTIPTIQFGLLVPMLIAYVLMRRSGGIARLVDAIPLSWLIGVQFYRALGFMFLVLWFGGHLPWQFALPAGIGDIATGVLAVGVATMVANRAAGAIGAARAWCWFGIGDLVVAVTMGTLTSPGPTHLLALDAPNMLISAYPLVMIPTFAVPLSIILHGVCLWKIRRLRASKSGQGAPVLA